MDVCSGTSAQQLDATFSTNASLEIFELDLADPALAMKSCGSFSSPHRYCVLLALSASASQLLHPGVLSICHTLSDFATSLKTV